MEMIDAVEALSALAHQGRLTIFRELVAAGPEGLSAGDVSRRVGIAPNTLSASFTILSHAGLVTSRREGRSIIYTAAFARMGSLLGFLMEDCCQGRPEICAPVTEAAERIACCA
ncbi:MAG: ArsR family transcriptional regulator [Brevundimonas sp.]|nr:MAG: ArsR family transcriptional regulator [Brevundimonas sp.]